MEATRARRERERARIVQKYGVLSDTDISRVLRIEDEQAECVGCSGTCTKDFFRYKRPAVSVVEGTVFVSNIPCKFGIDIYFRRDCFYAGIPERYVGRDFGDYRVTSDNDRAVKIAKYICVNKPGRGAYLYGGCGSGKTFLAALVAQSYVRENRSVVFRDMPALLTDIKDTFDSKVSTADFLNAVCEADLLVIDDIGAEKVTEWSVEQLYLIINRRYNLNRPLICTANYDLEGLERRLGSDLTARRIVGRIKEMCAEAFFGTKDWRNLK